MSSNYSLGDTRKNEMIEQELTQKADLAVNTRTKKINDSIQIITSQIETYNGLLINLKNVIELERTYRIENNQLFKQLKDNTHDVLTNDRKTYYEDQQNDILNTYYYNILWIIYVIVVICIIVFSLIYPSQNSWKVKIWLVAVFIFLPFISTWMLGKIIYIVYWVFNLLPKNVYK
jgi:hypothetical protein